MPAKSPASPAIVTEQLAVLGARIRTQRKVLRVSVHRIERDEPSEEVADGKAGWSAACR